MAPEIQRLLTIPSCSGEGSLRGVYITNTHRSDIHAGDRLLRVNGIEIPSDPHAARELLRDMIHGIVDEKRGDKTKYPTERTGDTILVRPVNIVVLRDGKEITVRVSTNITIPYDARADHILKNGHALRYEQFQQDLLEARESGKKKLAYDNVTLNVDNPENLPVSQSTFGWAMFEYTEDRPYFLRFRWPRLLIDTVAAGSRAEMIGLKSGMFVEEVDGIRLEKLPLSLHMDGRHLPDYRPEMIQDFFESRIGKTVTLTVYDREKHESKAITVIFDPKTLGATFLWTEHLNHCSDPSLPPLDIENGFFAKLELLNISVDGTGYFGHPTTGATIGVGMYLEKPGTWILRSSLHTQFYMSAYEFEERLWRPNIGLGGDIIWKLPYPFHLVGVGARAEGNLAFTLNVQPKKKEPIFDHYGIYAFLGPILTYDLVESDDFFTEGSFLYQRPYYTENTDYFLGTLFVSPLIGFGHLIDPHKCGFTLAETSGVVLPDCELGEQGKTLFMSLLRFGIYIQ